MEIVRGLKTSDETFARTKHFVEEIIHKKGVMVFESPGFVTTRLICLFINEALHVLEEGVASAEDIDSAMRIGYSFQHGPLEMADRFGLDSVLAALERMFREYGELKYRPSIVLKKMVRGGHLGVKSGVGFFKYDKDGDRHMIILVMNAGSSSLKYQLYNMEDESVLAQGRVERIGMDSSILTHEPEGKPEVREVSEILDHNTAVKRVTDLLTHSEHGVISVDERD